MIFNTFGNLENPVVIMLAGSFCPSESLEIIYNDLKSDYYIVAPTYNGCHGNSKAFTSRQNEAAEICSYIKSNGISTVKMVYGQSMGSEVGFELIYQLINNGIVVEHGFFDGAPCAFLSKPMRKIMFVVFRKFINSLHGKSFEDAMNNGLIKMMSNKDPELLKPMIEPIFSIIDYLTDETLKNQVECCYTFDFPKFQKDIEIRFHFFYGKSEKAYRLCFKKTKKSYPDANYVIKKEYGHCTYLVKNTDDYMRVLRSIMG